MPQSMVVLSSYDPGSLKYLLDVLGHGGVNTFPDHRSVCEECGTTIIATTRLDCCPACGEMGPLNPITTTNYSRWSANHSAGGACRFIEQAAMR